MKVWLWERGEHEDAVYRASDHYREVGGVPRFSRAEIAKIERWLVKRAQLLETNK